MDDNTDDAGQIDETSTKRDQSESGGKSKILPIVLIGLTVLFCGGVIAAILYFVFKKDDKTDVETAGSKRGCHGRSCGSKSVMFSAEDMETATTLSIRFKYSVSALEALNLVEFPRGDLFQGKNAIAAPTMERPVWRLTKAIADKLMYAHQSKKDASAAPRFKMSKELRNSYQQYRDSFIIMIYSNNCGWCKIFSQGYLDAAKDLLHGSTKLHLFVLPNYDTPKSYDSVLNHYPYFITFNAKTGVIGTLSPSGSSPNDLRKDVHNFYKSLHEKSAEEMAEGEELEGAEFLLPDEAKEENWNDSTETPGNQKDLKAVHQDLKALAKLLE